MALRYVTDQQLKDWLRRETSNNTATGESLVLIASGVEREFDDKCGTRFVGTEMVDVLVDPPDYDGSVFGGSVLSIPRCQSLTDVKLDGTSIGAAGVELRARTGILREGEGYKKLYRAGGWRARKIELTGTFGWDPTPEDITTAVLFQAELEFQSRSGQQPKVGWEGQIVMEDGKPYHKVAYETLRRYIEYGLKIGAI